MKTKFIENQIINLLNVYFKPKSELKYKVSKNDLWQFNYIGGDVNQYFLDYCNPFFDEDNVDLGRQFFTEIEELQTENSKIVTHYDEQERSIFELIYKFRLIFSLQTEYINDDKTLYNNKIKAIFQLCVENTNSDLARTEIVRFLIWNVATISEVSLISFKNSVLCYNDVALKPLLINVLQDIEQSKNQVIVAKDLLEFAIAIIEFLENGFQYSDTIKEFEILKSKAIEKFEL